MSLMKCDNCGCLVDTDAHPEAFVEAEPVRNIPTWKCLCRDCRGDKLDMVDWARRACMVEDKLNNPDPEDYDE